MAFVVKEIKNGKFFMQLPDGKIIELKPGMQILPNSVVFGADNNGVNAEMIINGGKTPIILKGFEVQVFDMSMFENNVNKMNENNIHNTENNINTNNQNHQNMQQQNTHQNMQHNYNPNNTQTLNSNPANIATAAGNNIHNGTDFLNADFKTININLQEVNFHMNLNNNILPIPIVTTIVNQTNVITTNVSSNIIREFLGVVNPDNGVVYEAGLPDGTHAGELPTVVNGNIFNNDTFYTGTVSILNVNGVAPNAQGIVEITTPNGNIFELNTNNGNYTYTLLHPLKDIVNGIPTDSITQNFNIVLNDNYGHTTNETVSIKIIDDKPEILGNTIDVSMNADDLPHIIADINIDSQTAKTLSGIIGSVTPETFNTIKTAFLNDITTIKDTIQSLVAVDNENQNYINLLKDYENKILYYINNLEMKPVGEEVTLINNDGSTQSYTVKSGDLLYHTDNGYLLVSNLQTHYVNPEALQIIDTKLNNLFDNYSQIIPQADLVKTVLNNLLTPDGIEHLKTLIDNNEFNIHLTVNGMQLDNGLFQINTIGLVADLGQQHINQTVTLADTNHLINNLQINGNLFDYFGHDGIVYSADGGHIEAITIGNESYNFNPNNPTQVIHTSNGDMHVNFITGEVSLDYNGNPNIPTALDIKQPITVTVVDNDGDSVSKNITLQFGLDDKVPELPNHIQNIDLGAGNDTILPVDLAHLPSDKLQTLAHLLGINEVNTDINFDNVTDVKNIEIINLDKVDNANVNNLSLNDVLNITDDRNHLVIVGDNDSVNKVNTDGWTKVTETHENIPIDNQGHTAAATSYVYTNGHEYVTLTVNDQIDHTGL